ncbi:hypothetical protein [Photobacterium leiognathi]|uniref:hypothetical protein n=1 Tax=Photobacterium leiognathi TaxID=553611 RepID=UPI002981EB26|nr:hypothetical protein [Photobacterium leiognathi]
MNKTKSETAIIVTLRAVIIAIMLFFIALLVYICTAIHYETLSWYATKESNAYSTSVLIKARADREAQLIKDGQLPFCLTPYDGCDPLKANEPNEDLN